MLADMERVPLLNAGKPGALQQYRPISLAPCLVKFMERLMAERIYNILELNVSLSKLQAEFHRGRSFEN